jgi:hypothetical protein
MEVYRVCSRNQRKINDQKNNIFDDVLREIYGDINSFSTDGIRKVNEVNKATMKVINSDEMINLSKVSIQQK